MQSLWKRFASSLTPGVRWALWVWTLAFLLNRALSFLHIADLSAAVVLTGPAVLHGQVWRLVSYALLPASVMDLLTNVVSVVIFGGMLERIWAPRDFFIYCVFAAVGAGLIKVALQAFDPTGLLGPGPISYALMMACGRLFANETIVVPPSFQLTMRQAVFGLVLISFVLVALSGGWANAVIRLSGGVFGLLYLWVRTEMGRPRQAKAMVSQRINRLEL